MYEDVHAKWGTYSLREITPDTHLWQLSGEVETRLEQLAMILMHVERAVADLQHATRSNPPGDTLKPWAEVVLFAEAFYLFAWRLVVMLRSKKYPFRGMAGLKAPGITIVRNQLIEHPELYGQKFGRYFTIDTEGPVLKSLPGIESVDRGLFVNARELRDEMLTRLNAVQT